MRAPPSSTAGGQTLPSPAARSDRRPSLRAHARQLVHDLAHHGRVEHLPHDRHVAQERERHGEEAREQVQEPEQLHKNACDRPAKDDEQDPAEEGDDAAPALPAREEPAGERGGELGQRSSSHRRCTAWIAICARGRRLWGEGDAPNRAVEARQEREAG